MTATSARERLRAELYALTHCGNPGDLEFYARRAKGARRVLELGCGSGRVLARIGAARRELVGLDADKAQLELARRALRASPAARRARVQLLHADMRTFALKARFQRIFLPYNALCCLLTQRDALACFRAARAALEPLGELALDIWNAEPFHRTPRLARASQAEPVAVLEREGDLWDVLERTRVRRSSQRLQVTYDYVPRAGGAVERIEIPQRYYLADELDSLLGRAGFDVVARYGDFSERRYRANSSHVILIARARLPGIE